MSASPEKWITLETARAIAVAYSEIAAGERLLVELREARTRHKEPEFRDAFGRPRGLSLGVPSGESCFKLYDIDPALAVPVIEAHVAKKRAEIAMLCASARVEMGCP